MSKIACHLEPKMPDQNCKIKESTCTKYSKWRTKEAFSLSCPQASYWVTIHFLYRSLLLPRLPTARSNFLLTISATTSALSWRFDFSKLALRRCFSLSVVWTASWTCSAEWPESKSHSVRTEAGTRSSCLDRRAQCRWPSHSSMDVDTSSSWSHASVIGGPEVQVGLFPRMTWNSRTCTDAKETPFLISHEGRNGSALRRCNWNFLLMPLLLVWAVAMMHILMN